jgi:hypothetical protein
MTISIFEDQDGAKKSDELAARWVTQTFATRVSHKPEIIAGKVLVHKTAGEE